MTAFAVCPDCQRFRFEHDVGRCPEPESNFSRVRNLGPGESNPQRVADLPPGDSIRRVLIHSGDVQIVRVFGAPRWTRRGMFG